VNYHNEYRTCVHHRGKSNTLNPNASQYSLSARRLDAQMEQCRDIGALPLCLFCVMGLKTVDFQGDIADWPV